MNNIYPLVLCVWWEVGSEQEPQLTMVGRVARRKTVAPSSAAEK